MNSAERLERIDLLKKQASLLRPRALKGNDKLLNEYYGVLKEIEKVQRMESGFQDIMAFAKNYFTGSPPHDLLKPDTPSPPFHYELAAYLRESVLDPMERKTAIAAPRSHAKSTLATAIFPIWCACYVEDVGERYWVIIADKQDNSKKFLDTIKSEFEDNDLLKADFGELKGATWNALEIITSNNVKISAHGAQEGLRGLRYGSFRPSVIMDDIESEDSCSTPERIAKVIDWFDRTVLPLGDPKHSKFYLIGTVIHYNSLLNQVINERPDWKAFKYRAIEKYPTNMHLWTRFEQILNTRDEGDTPMEAARIAHDNAMAFYKEHEKEMTEGAKVLWPERLDLLSLMYRRSTRRVAFLTEYMNEPIDADTRTFQKIWYYKPEDINMEDLDIYGACDPALGKSKRADPSVIFTLGRHRKTGILYVLDVDNKQRSAEQLIKDIFIKATAFHYMAFNIETIAFQQFFKDEVTKRSAQQNIYLPIKEFKSTVKKEIRIASLEPLVSSGQIRILPTQRDLEEQMLFFPRGKDDILDGLVMSVDLAKLRSGNFAFGKL